MRPINNRSEWLWAVLRQCEPRRNRMRVVAWRWCLSASLFLSACVSSSPVSNDRASLHTTLAAQYYAAGQLQTAVAEAQTALSANQRYVPAHHLLGILYGQILQTEQADRHFESALQFAQADAAVLADVRNSAAWHYCQSGRESAGLSLLAHVLREPLYPSMDKALINAAVCAGRLQQWALASAYIEAAHNINRQNPWAKVYGAHIALSQGQLTQAKADAKQVEQMMGKEHAEVVWLLARIEYAQNPNSTGLQRLRQQLQTQFATSAEHHWMQADRWSWF